MFKKLPDLKYLKHLFELDYESGILYWKNPPKNAPQLEGQVAGCVSPDSDGVERFRVTIDGKMYSRSRLNYYLYTGHDPVNHYVDHEHFPKTNDHISNLRLATASENGANRKKSEGTTSKYKGVSWDKSRQKWQAKINAHGKWIWLGRFDTEEEASDAYMERARMIFGEHASDGLFVEDNDFDPTTDF